MFVNTPELRSAFRQGIYWWRLDVVKKCGWARGLNYKISAGRLLKSFDGKQKFDEYS